MRKIVVCLSNKKKKKNQMLEILYAVVNSSEE